MKNVNSIIIIIYSLYFNWQNLTFLYLSSFQVESVNLALNILDGWKIRGKTLSVQRAKFQLKGEYDPSKKPKKKKKDKERQKKFQEK